MDPTSNYSLLASVLTVVDGKLIFMRKQAPETAVVKIGQVANMADVVEIMKTVTVKINLQKFTGPLIYD